METTDSIRAAREKGCAKMKKENRPPPLCRCEDMYAVRATYDQRRYILQSPPLLGIAWSLAWLFRRQLTLTLPPTPQDCAVQRRRGSSLAFKQRSRRPKTPKHPRPEKTRGKKSHPARENISATNGCRLHTHGTRCHIPHHLEFQRSVTPGRAIQDDDVCSAGS